MTSSASDPAPPAFTETFCSTRDGAGTGLVLAQMDAVLARMPGGKGPVLWVQEARAAQEGGVPCQRGIAELGLNMPILRIAARSAADALWAMEEGLECAALSAVVGEIWGNPKALDFTATKRLALRSRQSGVPFWLLRPDGVADLSVAPDRWRVSATRSSDNPWDARAPGRARWLADLFRTRRGAPATWVAGHDPAAHRVDLVAALPDRALGEGDDRAAQPALRSVGGGG
ncbi:ImuA family protein [Jannaschia donghaensis]|uniref:Protein ImuA n=1 Tax=Jannaschia donghaensis TaxID=420998 RepID=A0A0M6YGN4_9RHOB|nr:hypothetical protein [Jannaschia donghaensis]CTQ49511.1 hypothetical protein JDO7802_01525 [Jannaschia donghaensis]